MSEDDRKNMPGRAFEPFTWAPKNLEDFPHTNTLNRVISLSLGISVALEIIEADDLNDLDASSFGSMLSAAQKGALMRMAIEATHVMCEECTEAFEHAKQHGMDQIRRLVAREDKRKAAKA
jgi:hypothetical protein